MAHHIWLMAYTDLQTINRRGCWALGVFLLLLMLLAGWIATRTPDGAAADEAMSEALRI
jgi:hypothetical protein